MDSFLKRYPKKRDLFYKLVKADRGLIGIAGVRRIGKTVLLRQLCETLNGCYYTFDDVFTADGFHDRVFEIVNQIENDDKPVFIDEIIRIPNEYLGRLFCTMKEYHDCRLIMFTGSYPKAVNDLRCKMGRGVIYNLYSLSYSEYCKWFGEHSVVNFLKYSMIPESASIEQCEPDKFMIDYMKSIVEGARESWLHRLNEDATVTDLLRDINLYTNLMSFIEMSTITYRTGKIIGKPEYKNEFKVALEGETNRFLEIDKQEKISGDYKTVFNFLDDSYLGIPTYDMVIEDNKFVPYYSDSVDHMVFTLQWMLTVFDGYFHKNLTDIRYPHMLEYYALLALAERGYLVGKYREGKSELDVVVLDNKRGRSFAIEFKSCSQARVKRHQVKDYCILCDKAGVDRLIVINSDTNCVECFRYKIGDSFHKRLVYYRTPDRLFRFINYKQYD